MSVTGVDVITVVVLCHHINSPCGLLSDLADLALIGKEEIALGRLKSYVKASVCNSCRCYCINLGKIGGLYVLNAVLFYGGSIALLCASSLDKFVCGNEELVAAPSARVAHKRGTNACPSR